MTTNTGPDEVMAVAASYDATLRYGAQTPFSDQMTSHLEGGQWQVDNTHTSLIAAGNGGVAPVQAALTIFYDRGRQQYRLERTIPADDQWWINIGDLVRNQVPDVNGNILPADLNSGAYQLKEIGGTQQNALYEGKVVTDKTYGHATYGCMMCCGYGGDAGVPYLIADPTGVAVSQTSGLDAFATNACNGSPDNVNQYFTAWSTADSSVMTATQYSVSGVAVGSTQIRADASALPSGQGQRRTACPRSAMRTTGTGNVNCNFPTNGSTQFSSWSDSEGLLTICQR